MEIEDIEEYKIKAPENYYSKNLSSFALFLYFGFIFLIFVLFGLIRTRRNDVIKQKRTDSIDEMMASFGLADL